MGVVWGTMAAFRCYATLKTDRLEIIQTNLLLVIRRLKQKYRRARLFKKCTDLMRLTVLNALFGKLALFLTLDVSLIA